MKSIVALAAVAAATVAFGATNCQLQDGPTPAQEQVTTVYQWKFTGKTTTGYMIKDVQEVGGSTGSNCTLGEKSTKKISQCAIRVPGALAIVGYTYICDACCDSFKETNGNTNPDEFYMTKPYKDAVCANIAIDVANVIGKNKNQYEVFGTAEFTSVDPQEKWTLAFAGLGSFKKPTQKGLKMYAGYMTSVCGNFAGKLESPYYVKNGVCAPADHWTCDTLEFAGEPDVASVAYGTWCVKYNSSASKRFAQGYAVKTPAYPNKGACQK